MKKVLLLGVALIIGLAVISQAQFRGNVTSYKAFDKKAISVDPVTSTQGSSVITPLPNQTKSANVVTILTLGTSANGLGWGYGGGQRDHLWADNNLKAVAQAHRMGPGAAPPSFSGYLAMDHAANYGATAADWSVNYQVYAATMNSGGTYYADAARYPLGAIYNPAGNTTPSNSYLCYFAANLSDLTYSWGGYSYGRSKWGTQSDTTKHLSWYSPPPRRYIPDGYTITAAGTAIALDIQYDQVTTTVAEGLYLSTGTWNSATNDYDYAFSTLALDSPYAVNPTSPHCQGDPSGEHLWIGLIGNNGGATPVFDSTYYPIFFHSTDDGATWSNPIPVTLDGPNGIPAIKNYISDARLATVYAGTPPPRDEIAYTTCFDGDVTVDKWGNPHMVVGIAFPGGGFSVVSPDGANSPKFDSTMAIFDIFSTDLGTTWCGRMIGITKRFRGLFPSATYPEDLRSNISRNSTGDKIFYTWNDTWVASATDNSSPDIFARGWDLIANKLTNNSGQDAGTNATYLSDVTQNAVAGDQAQMTLTKPDGSNLIPMVCESLVGNDMAQAVTFKYVSDFSYAQSAFTINAAGPVWGSDCSFPVGINEPVAAASLTASVYPNPVRGIASVKVTVPQKGAVTIQLTNLVGQTVMSLNRTIESSDTFSLDASQLTAGVYFYTVKQGSQKVTGKIIVE